MAGTHSEGWRTSSGEQLADHLTLQKRSVTEDTSPPGEGSQPGREPEEKLRDLESALKAQGERQRNEWGFAVSPLVFKQPEKTKVTQRNIH